MRPVLSRSAASCPGADNGPDSAPFVRSRTAALFDRRGPGLAIDLTTAMINATVEIDQPQADGKRIVGTGFLISDPKPDGTPRTVLITAGHVFNNMSGQSARIGYRFQG